MPIESWMISAGFGAATLIGVGYLNKYKTDQNVLSIEKEVNARERAVKENKGSIDAIGKKLDEATKELAEHKIRLANAPSMRDVDDKFVSKEMFKQMEKHIDDKFDSLGKHLTQITSNQMMLADKIDNLNKDK